MTPALAHLRVVDFGIFFAGPYASRLLADLGAQVIKVENLTGDAFRRTAPAFNNAQRGKRAIAIDLKAREGKEIAHALVRWADVVQHNMRPGVAERLGIDYASLRALNPGLIYLYSPGYGSRGPRAHLGSFEPLVSGLTGIQEMSAGEGNRPVPGVANMDYGNAMLGATAIMMALLHRERTGEGQYIECAQMSSGMFCTADIFWMPDGSLGPHLRLDAGQAGLGPLLRLYPTRDGWICINCYTETEWRRLATALDLERLIEDPRFGTPSSRQEHGAALAEQIGERLCERTAEEWWATLDAAGVPCEIPVDNGRERFLDDPESERRGWVADYDHPVYGRMRELGQVMRFSDAPGHIQGPAPTIGQHSAEILRELGYAEETIADLLRRDIIRTSLETGAIN
jgi:crotonobetainyl-CoA:carnitine CoA-transferase CaiB-like acyl-CoA transferase